MEITANSEERTQRLYARFAGLLFLWLIINLAATLVLSRIAGGGTLAETTQSLASERLHRVVLSSALLLTVGGALLFFALYVTLKPVNDRLALLALIFSLLDSSLGFVVRICGFVKLHLYTSASTVGAATTEAHALADLMRNVADTTENIGGILFGTGSLLFFYLFFKSKYIPRPISSAGLIASVIWVVMYFGNLVFPELHAIFQYVCFPPMGVAHAMTGFWLLLFAVRKHE